MKLITKLFAAFGFAVAALSVLGAIGIGDFRLYYGPDINQSNLCSPVKESSRS